MYVNSTCVLNKYYDSTDFVQSATQLNFAVASVSETDIQCYNVSWLDDDCELFTNCSDYHLLSQLNLLNESDLVSLIEDKSTVEVVVILPEKCTTFCQVQSPSVDSETTTTADTSLSSVAIAAIVLSSLVVIVIVSAIAVVVVYQKTKSVEKDYSPA